MKTMLCMEYNTPINKYYINKGYLTSLPIVDSFNSVRYTANLTTSFPPIILSGERHLTGGHKSLMKPAGHNTCRDDQPITVDEGSGTSTQNVIVIEVSVIVLH